jgi:hypothetical protein
LLAILTNLVSLFEIGAKVLSPHGLKVIDVVGVGGSPNLYLQSQ